MTTTTIVNAEARAASSGGVSTPVKTTLQAGTHTIALQLKVVTTKGAPGQEVALTHTFGLYYATSPEDLTADATLPNLLSGCAQVLMMTLDTSKRLTQRQQALLTPKGGFLYTWYEYPRSTDAYAVSVHSTELESFDTP